MAREMKVKRNDFIKKYKPYFDDWYNDHYIKSNNLSETPDNIKHIVAILARKEHVCSSSTHFRDVASGFFQLYLQKYAS